MFTQNNLLLLTVSFWQILIGNLTVFGPKAQVFGPKAQSYIRNMWKKTNYQWEVAWRFPIEICAAYYFKSAFWDPSVVKCCHKMGDIAMSRFLHYFVGFPLDKGLKKCKLKYKVVNYDMFNIQ